MCEKIKGPPRVLPQREHDKALRNDTDFLFLLLLNYFRFFAQINPKCEQFILITDKQMR